jgi:hypothetical protein
VDTLEKLFALLVRIGENIGRFDRYRTLFATSGSMQHALALIYVDIVEITVGAALFYKRHTLSRSIPTILFMEHRTSLHLLLASEQSNGSNHHSNVGNALGTILKDFDSRFGDQVARFNRHKELVEDEAWAAFLERVLPNTPGLSLPTNLCFYQLHN